MSTLKELRWHRASAPMHHPVRQAAAASLQCLGSALCRLAVALTTEVRTTPRDPLLEFHAEAGAPEGALYVDGRLVGWLPGVRRL